ncbi:hypothetical protein CEE34_11005 [Candidatus Aerophobetes bacterium Ae_b3a]|nr:MAG: hypothetical protein CEE34_11005 [Candidatus Aerophobetes bacterium Ae_b3a]
MAHPYQPHKKKIKFANPKESAQNGYEFAASIAKRLYQEKHIRCVKSELLVDIEKIYNDYVLYESEIEARS